MAALSRLSPSTRLTSLHILLWLALLQGLRALFSGVFGVAYDVAFAGSAGLNSALAIGVALLLAFLSPIPGRWLNRRLALVLVIIALACRVPMSLDLPGLRLWTSLAVVAAGFMAVAFFVRRQATETVTGLVVALLIDQVLRAAGHTWDLTLQPWWWLVASAIALLAVGLAASLWRSAPILEISSLDFPSAIALPALLFLQLNLLGLPNALARWAGTPYAWTAPTLLGASLVGAWLGLRLRGSALARLCFALLMVIDLALGDLASAASGLGALIGPQFLWLPPSLYLPGIGPLSAAQVALAALAISAASSIALLAALPQPGSRRWTTFGLTVGSFAFLLLTAGLTFAFTYPYTLPQARDTGIFWYLAAALLGAFGMFGSKITLPAPRLWRWAPLSVAAVALVGWQAMPFAMSAPPVPSGLRLGTYNIHYGYDEEWHLSLARQAETIQGAGLDLVALQEVDTARITSYGIDDALWLAQRVGMYVVYLPTVERLTGVALLSRYPIVEAHTIPLPSEEEATGLIHARILVEGKTIDAFATWLGLSEEERARQISAATSWMLQLSPTGPAFFAGDLNSLPDSATYRSLVAAGFLDPFRSLGLGDVPTDAGNNPRNRIDYIWLRDLTPTAADAVSSAASDHRLVWVEVVLP